MIQRIQSLYLITVSFFYLLYWFFGYEFYEKGFVFVEEYLGSLSNFFFSLTSFLPLLISIICFITIWLFKKRVMQINFSKLALFLSILISIYTIFYFSLSLNDLINLMESKKMEVLLYVAILNPFVCTFLIFLTIKCINSDDKLVRGEGLIR